jgi:circadian clock protein KaiB
MMKKAQGIDKKNVEEGSNVYRLYITGASPNSSRAVTNIKTIFERYLKDKYQLSIIDVYQQPQVTKDVNIVALPLLIRLMPVPEKRLIGDMSDEDKVIKSLDLVKS